MFYLSIVQNLEMFTLPKAKILVGAGIVVIESYEYLCVCVGQLWLGLGNRRRIHEIARRWVSRLNGVDDIYSCIDFRRVGAGLSEALAHDFYTISITALSYQFQTIHFSKNFDFSQSRKKWAIT